MRILVTGGSGVVGEATVRALVKRGHTVRLLTRHADEAAREWPDGVEPRAGDVTRPDTLHGAADGCDAVLHVVGIVDESPPDSTFDKVNVEGTRHVVQETARAGVPHLVYVSSLGAETGESPYHRSKKAGEEIVRRFGGRWVIVRPGNVYGPGDDVISLLLKMVRTLPAVPVIAGGDQEFQPVWADDVGEALAAAVERADLAGKALDVAGPERTCVNDLLDRFGRLTGREPTRIPVPGMLAGLGARVAGVLGVEFPVNDSQLTMLREGNVIEPPKRNALLDVLGVRPTALDDGLRRLLDALPEQLPEQGVGPLHRKRFWADIRDATVDANALFARFCQDFDEISPDQMHVGAEPGTPTAVRERGQTVTMSLPMRGNVQVRVAELGPTLLTLQTVEGHPLAGAVRFTLGPPPTPVDTGVLRFQVELYDRAANVVDWLAMATVGNRMQDATWRETIERIVRESGGTAEAGVQTDEATLDGPDAEGVEAWLRELALSEKQARNTP
ncbi:NAD-dependent epimerase/dehydratase [Gemmatirosa kalamazoonensis]|uniref:NAD-dependent epimerase/dehydratase n=1 Tax=Gemmatirosa kalamazoonensis TaxID=861299 RepID=W0RQH2_9BACT|nr:complex I NDUFA9 subunit family protein [Gemmatirosa kalamazoonensis]AHG91783.1 NAD-dependent epimerase/dehydratase [Gemmatirosa kalamazoonensis]